jgi:peptidoglycan/xylan/chitin deacetylase (PgdA/CDA1 family)
VNFGTFARAPLALGYWLGVAGSARRDNGCARVLMLHGVPRRHERLVRSLLAYVRRCFHVVPLQTLLADNLRLRNQLAITFDDGLRNNVEVAYPILKELELPATFFVCPALISGNAWLWNHEARQRLRRLQLAPEQVEAKIESMKRLPFAERQREEEQIRQATPAFVPTEDERHEFDLAGWHELEALDPALITIGSHTLTHPILPSLDAARLESEISQSRKMLEDRLQRPVDLFAYPNGDVDARTLDCVRRHYRAAVTVEEGNVLPGSDPHLLPRINVPGSRLRFALALHRAHFLATPTSQSGSQVASSGNTVMMARHSTIMKKNGSEARAT